MYPVNVHQNKKTLFLLGCFFLLIILALLAICAGAYSITPPDVFYTIYSAILGNQTGNPIDELVVLNIRLPRILLTIAIGAGLAVAGCVYQGIFRNPLVDPYLLGVSSGAAFGAGIAIVLGFFLSPSKSPLYFFPWLLSSSCIPVHRRAGRRLC